MFELTLLFGVEENRLEAIAHGEQSIAMPNT
jgi:hypothetical protein